MSDKIERVPLDALKPYARNARTHSKQQISQIARSIERFGFTNPVLVSDELTIIAGHGRVEAAKLLGSKVVPVVRLSHLSEAELKAYVIADNRLAELSGWDKQTLAIELQALVDLDFDVEVVGYEAAEIDLILDECRDADPTSPQDPDDVAVPARSGSPVTMPGDIWECGRHRLICGNSLELATYERLVETVTADVIFTDPPYNVPIEGFVGGKGKETRREFAMASGEMSSEAFQSFLHTSLSLAAKHARDGAIAFVCMDWRHIGELQASGAAVFSELKNVCVWTKSNGGMGSLYRSQHELVFVFKNGNEPHKNNVELGRYGRNRTNVWSYRGVNAFGSERMSELEMHPTVKPVALVEDAIKDVTRRGEVVLDPFGGSGSTMIAAERCGRVAKLIEIDAAYCDVIVRRWQQHTGKNATRAGTGERFSDIASNVSALA
jgi:DNA modification methylase